MFPNLKGNDIDQIKKQYNTSNVKFLFDKVHDKYSVSHNEVRTYHHYFYEVDSKVDGDFFTLDELLKDPKIKENNGDVIQFISEYYRQFGRP